MILLLYVTDRGPKLVSGLQIIVRRADVSSDPLQLTKTLELLFKLKPVSQYSFSPHRTLPRSQLFAENKLYQLIPPDLLRQEAKVFGKRPKKVRSHCALGGSRGWAGLGLSLAWGTGGSCFPLGRERIDQDTQGIGRICVTLFARQGWGAAGEGEACLS